MKHHRRTSLLQLSQSPHRFGVGLLLLCGGILLVMLVMEKSRPEMMQSVRAHSSDIIAPVASLLTAPKEAINSYQTRIDNFFHVYEQNKQLKAENDQLRKWEGLAQQYFRENEQMKMLLQVAPQGKQHYVSGRLVGANQPSGKHSAMLSAGEEDGVRESSAVIGAGGLIGRIIDVGTSHSRVLLITDINANIPVKSVRNDAPAILTGHQGGQVLRVELAHEKDSFALGDVLVTSGDGGVMPAGIPVARIVATSESDIIASPLADLHHSSFVTAVNYQF